jgi:hypothetical protein
MAQWLGPKLSYWQKLKRGEYMTRACILIPMSLRAVNVKWVTSLQANALTETEHAECSTKSTSVEWTENDHSKRVSYATTFFLLLFQNHLRVASRVRIRHPRCLRRDVSLLTMRDWGCPSDRRPPESPLSSPRPQGLHCSYNELNS